MIDRTLGRSAAAGASALALVVATGFLACSDDDGAKATVVPDAAVADATAAGDGSDDGCPPADTTPRTCTAAKCSADLGEPAVCVDNACVKLKTADCPRVGGAVDDDDAIVLGVVHSNRGSNATAGNICNNAIDLAVTEINGKGGIPQQDRCKKPRPLAYVACDDTMLDATGSPVVLEAGAKSPREKTLDHLAAELKVPAIVGGVSSGDVTNMAKYVIPTHKTMFFTTRGSSNYLREPEKAPVDSLKFNASPNGTRLFWRATQNVEIQAKGLQLAYYELEKKLTTDRARPVKLALVMKNDAYGQGLGGLFYQGLKVNAAAPDGNAGFRSITYRFKNAVPGLCVTVAQGGACGAEIDQPSALTELENYKPDIIIHIGTDEIITTTGPEFGLIQPYEQWIVDTSVPANERPYYLGAHGLRNAKLTTLVDGLAGSVKDDVRARTRGFFPGRTTPSSQDFFNFRFKPAYNDGAALIPGVLEGYDAIYILAYAMAATGAKGPITSKAIVDAIPSVVTGTERVNVGPTPFSAAAKKLAAGETIDLDGVFSPLVFDAFGEAPSDASIWCIGIDPNTSKAFFNESTGQYYDAAKTKLEGAYACP